MIEAVFLDRDGVINREVDYLVRPDQLELIPGSAEAIQKLNDAGIVTVVITNQSVVARNMCSEEELERIHRRLNRLLADETGATLDAIYYCPHYPDPQLEGGNPTFCIPCDCRKPATGLAEKAAEEFDLDLTSCVLVGDTTGDILTGIDAGCRTILVRTGYGGRDGEYDATPDAVCDDLAEAATLIIENTDRS